MFLFGPPNVDKMFAQKNVKGLVKALGYSKDMQVVQSVFQDQMWILMLGRY